MIEHELFDAILEITPHVYVLMMPEEKQLPAIVYRVVHDSKKQATNGNGIGRDARFQIDVYAHGYWEAKTLKDEVIAKVISLGGGDISAQDLYEDETKLYRQLIDFTIKRR